jgi:uncharacterized protein (TIGR03437 family)
MGREAADVRDRLSGWGRASQLLFAVLLGARFAASFVSAATPQNLVLQVSSETAPAGGWVQIKVFAATPALIVSGRIAMDLDPSVFGDVAAVTVFSAQGDAVGFADVQAGHLDAQFSSVSGGIGQLPDLPIFTVRVPVLANAAAKSAALNVDPSGSPWTDPLGNTYLLTVNSGFVTIAGAAGLYLQEVIPGGGLLPKGTTVRIRGGGFDSTTKVSIDGVSIASTAYMNPSEIDVTLGAAAELTGKHIRVVIGLDAAQVDFYAALPSIPGPPISGQATVHLIPSLRPYQFATLGVGMPATTTLLALLNQSQSPVHVSFAVNSLGGNFLQFQAITIPPETFELVDTATIAVVSFGTLALTASSPIRILGYENINRIFHQETIAVANFTTSPPILRIDSVSPTQIDWNWQIGTPAPQATTVTVLDTNAISASVTQGAPWLKVTSSSAGPSPPTLTVAADPAGAGLKPGKYSGVITIAPAVPDSITGFALQTATVAVSLTVADAPFLLATTDNTYINPTAGGAPPAPINIKLTSSGSPVGFTATASTSAGGQWLSVTPFSGATPAMLTVVANPAGLATATNYDGTITIQGPANTITVTPTLYISPATTTPPPIRVDAQSLSFVLEAGQGPSQQTGFTVTPAPIQISVSTQTQSGNWLIVNVVSTGASPTVMVKATAANLGPGVYQGTITVTSISNGSVQVPVTLTVLPPATAQTKVTVSPSSITLTGPVGQTFAPQTLTVDSAGGPVLFSISSSGGALYLTGSQTPLPGNFQPVTPATFSLMNGTSAFPGVYHGAITVTWSTGSVVVPVTINTTASPATPPILGAIVNAASNVAGSISPGEIITILGAGVGPGPIGPMIGVDGKLTTSAGSALITINGIAAPLIYGSPNQVSAIVPYEIGSAGVANIQASSGGANSDIWGVPIGPTAPAIFTIGSTGVGQGAILNQDNSVNGPSNPAARGSTIQIYATGEGQTSPPGVTGSITHSDLKTPLGKVTVTIGGLDAHLIYAGSAGDAVAGLLQVNVVVPQVTGPGPMFPVSITVGGVRSQIVTMAVQ